MSFVKYIDENTVQNAPLVLIDDKKVYSNPSDEILRAFGYLPLIDCEIPVEEGYTFTKRYEVDGDNVLVVWDKREIPQPEPETPAENVSDESESRPENVQDEDITESTEE